MAEAIKQQHVDSERLKRFMTHLAFAAKTVEEKNEAKEKVKAHVENLKQLSQQKVVDKSDLSDALAMLEDSLKKVLHDEEQILTSQKAETRTVNELKNR
ncbi:MAG: hypothetical protein KJ574_05380, partial [Nanoarchaeota archaeon]|nr:hypothetical protein [Nanoarchaeota archaeon]